MTRAYPLLDELTWLNPLLHTALRAFRRNLEDPYRGLYVSDQEADAAVDTLPFLELTKEHADGLRSLRRRWQGLEQNAAEDALSRLVRAAHLSHFERGVLLLCLAPEIDLRYQRLYAYLHDDIAKKAPTVELALNVLCLDAEERLHYRHLLASQAPLLVWGLVEVVAPDAVAPSLAAQLKLSERLRHALLGAQGQIPPLPMFIERVSQVERIHDVRELSEPTRTLLRDAGAAPWIQIVSHDPAARRNLAQGIARERKAPLLVIPGRTLMAHTGPSEEIGSTLRRASCETLVSDAVIYWDDLDTSSSGGVPSFVRDHLRAAPGVQIFGTSTPRAVVEREDRPCLVIELPELTVEAREQLWRRALNASGSVEEESIDITSLAARYPLDEMQIEQALRLALAGARTRSSSLQRGDLERACRITAAPHLGDLAERVSTGYAWEDLVLPSDKLEVLREICLHARYRALVGERWGFSKQTVADRGLSVLFSGPSGTGKTLSAGIVAREVGLDLYRVDLARLVSKYIGETEKNIARVFDAVRRSGACLLFDEADAVFAKRSEVKDSHDRFANLETSYLLQRLEQHDGVVFLSTNFRHNIDSAFTRRLSFVVHFNPPDELQRAELWRRVWPPEAPLARDIDFQELARKHTLTGGNIRSAALAAAVRACAERREVRQTDIERAIGREYEKMGKAKGG